MGRARKGTGFFGSEMYSSNAASPGPASPAAASPALGAAKLSFRPALRYNGVGLMVHPLLQPAGHAGSWRHILVPVSNAVPGAPSDLGASDLGTADLADALFR